ncbi:hypothetical protein F5Y10DRAFT_276486 [Nemania abortiva]|nr:hypothetical protein F5Y10DRAFT_276486 [Nemania abortiva]
MHFRGSATIYSEIKERMDKPEPRRPKRLHASFLKNFTDLANPVRSREKLCQSDSHLYRSDSNPISRHLTRSAPVMGYTLDIGAFKAPLMPPSTRPQLHSPGMGAYRENNLECNHIYVRHPDTPLPSAVSSLRFPFLSVEIKAAGGTRGDLWVATNQCADASAACLNAVDQLNKSHEKYQRKERVDSFPAQLYISWKKYNLNYYLQRVDDTHLNQIRDALDNILEENRRGASEVAKSRPPPFVSSGTSSG